MQLKSCGAKLMLEASFFRFPWLNFTDIAGRKAGQLQDDLK